MTPRTLAREFRDFPTTLVFCSIWIAVFAAMTAAPLADGSSWTWSRWLLLGFGGGHRYGDLTLKDLAEGQVWRLSTCNFVHYSLVHIALNLLAMYQLGTLVESWYGSAQVLFIFGLTGGGGNLLSALVRFAIGSNREVHSAGGSVVIMGLIGLCAVAGAQSRDPLGKLLGRQMVIFLVLTALLGIALPNYIDNWGHAGGTLVGAALGLAHPWFRSHLSRPSAWGSGVLTGLVLAACGWAQFLEDRWENAPARVEKGLTRRLNELETLTWELERLGRIVEGGGDPRVAGDWAMLRHRLDVLDDSSRAAVRQLFPLVETAKARPLSDRERRLFHERLVPAIWQVLRESQLQRRRLWQLRRAR